MPAGKLDLYIEQGATFLKSLLWKTSDDDPIDLTDYTARMQIREKLKDENPVIELTTENNRIILGGEEGTITLTISADDTSDLTIKKGVYDLELVSGGGVVTRLLEGAITVAPEVTR